MPRLGHVDADESDCWKQTEMGSSVFDGGWTRINGRCLHDTIEREKMLRQDGAEKRAEVVLNATVVSQTRFRQRDLVPKSWAKM